MNNTQKALINQDVCEQTTPNLGITQSSGLDRHAVVVENHPQDSRVSIRKDGTVQTLTGQMGTGGGMCH